MMKKLIKNLWLVAVACAAVGCSVDESLGGEVDAQRCQGRLGVDGVASAEVVSRAEVAEIDLAALCGLQVPQPSELRLTLTGKAIQPLVADETGELKPDPEHPAFDYSATWAMLAEYDEPALYPGTYTALLEYGDPEATGPAKPYYKGEAQATVEVAKKTPCKVAVTIANSAVRITATDNFNNYFSDAHLRLVIDGKETDYEFTQTDTFVPVFVPAGTQVAVKGAVRRPSQTTADDADGEELPIDVPARSTAAGTLHTFRFTAQAGGANVDVVFEDFGAGSDDDVELNDDAKRDEPAQDGGVQNENTPAE